MSGLEMMQHYHTWLHNEEDGHNSDPPHTIYDKHSVNSHCHNTNTTSPTPPPPPPPPPPPQCTTALAATTSNSNYTTTYNSHNNYNNYNTKNTSTHTNTNNHNTNNNKNTKLFKRNNTLIWGMSATANNYDQQAGLKLGMHIFSIKPVCNNTILYMLSIRKNMSTLSQWIRAVVTYSTSSITTTTTGGGGKQTLNSSSTTNATKL